MRKITFIGLLFLTIVKLHAQDYQITFMGVGASSVVDSVKVENLFQNKSITINGSDILHLVGTITGIPIREFDKQNSIQIYPNPMLESSIITFNIPTANIVSIEVFDLSGKAILKSANNHSEGYHSYQIKGLQKGIYSVRISTPSVNYTTKILCTATNNNVSTLSYQGQSMSKELKKLKSYQSLIDWQYTEGDRLLSKAYSGNYATINVFIPSQDETIISTFIPATDGDGNHYPIVIIGTQTWLAENLKTTSFNDNSVVPYISDSSSWASQTSSAFCWYRNDSNLYKNTYGALYNWYVTDSASNGGKNICPTGWHVSQYNDWDKLSIFLNMSSSFGGALKSTIGWNSPNTDATNLTGFSALPGGYRYGISGIFYSVVNHGFWWNATSYNINTGNVVRISYNNAVVFFGNRDKKDGNSIRCIKD